MEKLVKQIVDICECSICNSDLTKPKSLPCLHTFCLQCLQAYCDSQAGAKFRCPVCRKEFSIAGSGCCANLPDNFHLEQLRQLAGSLKTEKSTTGLCADHSKPLELYCSTCQLVICLSCLTRNHRKHEIDDAAEEVNKLLTVAEPLMLDARSLLIAKKNQTSMNDSEGDKLRLLCEENAKTIDKVAEKLKLFIDEQAATLIADLCNNYDSTIEYLDCLRQDKEMEKLEELSEFISPKLKTTAILSARGKIMELQNFLSTFDDKESVHPRCQTILKFTENKLVIQDLEIGTIYAQHEYEINLSFTDCCFHGNNVYSVNLNRLCVDVWEKDTWEAVQSTNIITGCETSADLKIVQIITASQTIFINIYVCKNEGGETLSYIFKYNPLNDEFSKFKDCLVCRISATGQGNLLVKFSGNYLIEYAANGKQLSRLNIPEKALLPKVIYLTQDFRLNNNQYITTSYNRERVKLSLLSPEGQFVTSYEKNVAANISVATDYERFVFMLELFNGVVDIFNTNLELIGELSFPGYFKLVYEIQEDCLVLLKDKRVSFLRRITK